MFILPISPANAALASATPAELTRDGGSFDRRECELAGDMARSGDMLSLKRSAETSAMEGGWLRSNGTEGGLDVL